jgi:PAS domain S-box-containing protein
VQFNSRIVDLRDSIRRHDVVRRVGVGGLAVAAAMLLKLAARDWGADAPSYVLFDSAIVVATWFGGWPAGVVATLAAGLLALFVMQPVAAAGSIVGGSSFLLFTAEALFFVALVARLRRRRAEVASQSRLADAEIARLRRRERDLQVIEQAFEAVGANLRESACFLLDPQGRVVQWNRGAERLYGYPASSVVGKAWPALGALESAADDELRELIDARANAAPAVGVGWMRREDGRRFRGEVSATPLGDTTGVARGFAVVVRDLTTEQASEEFRTQAITAQEALQGEADALTDRLEAIQTVLDPELSDLPVPALLKELTGRVLTTLNVDGVAFVDTRQGANAVVFTAARGLQAQAKRGARSVPRRLRIIQNDAARAREGSVVAWPEAVGLMVTVPVAREKLPFGALEVVTLRARRWTERDAIVLLLAADRAAAVLAAATAYDSPESTAKVDPDRLSLLQ